MALDVFKPVPVSIASAVKVGVAVATQPPAYGNAWASRGAVLSTVIVTLCAGCSTRPAWSTDRTFITYLPSAPVVQE